MLPVALKVRDFVLPDQSSLDSAFWMSDYQMHAYRHRREIIDLELVMEAHTKDLEAQALQLDQQTRARLAVSLIRSLEMDQSLSRDEIDALWLREAEDRLSRMESGEDPGIDLRDAIAEARKRVDT